MRRLLGLIRGMDTLLIQLLDAPGPPLVGHRLCTDCENEWILCVAQNIDLHAWGKVLVFHEESIVYTSLDLTSYPTVTAPVKTMIAYVAGMSVVTRIVFANVSTLDWFLTHIQMNPHSVRGAAYSHRPAAIENGVWHFVLPVRPPDVLKRIEEL
jgi:hypothetical protein